MGSSRCAVILVAVVVAVGAGGPSCATAATVIDMDADGIIDPVDECPDTPAREMVNEQGCSVCPCEATTDFAWSSRTAYIECVASEVTARKAAGLMRAKQARAAIRAARRSSCGDTQLTRCCVYANENAEVGRCRLMRVDACDALDDRLFDATGGEADDEGPGSCLPNPCVY